MEESKSMKCVVANKKSLLNKRLKSRRRLMNKSGQFHIQLLQLPYKYFRYTKDCANTLVHLRWRWVTLSVILINSFFFVLFSGLWMLDAWISGDFSKTANFCISATREYTGYLQLSIQTITTTGYGYLHPTENCHLLFFTLTLSTLVMILIDGAFISVVFLKVCKPLRKDALEIFSKRAVINLRNGKLCLVIKINDSFKKHVIGPKVTLHFFDTSKTNTAFKFQELKVNNICTLFWPVDVVHVIDKHSPLWNFSARHLISAKFEVCACVSGTSLVTSQFSSSMTSYSSEEIKWGFRFVPMMKYEDAEKNYIVRDLFEMVPCDTPLCSAKDLGKFRVLVRNLPH